MKLIFVNKFVLENKKSLVTMLSTDKWKQAVGIIL